MDDNIAYLPQPLAQIAERIRAAYDRAAKGEREWIAGTLELAEALTEGRERFPDNGHFSHWLIDQDLDAIGANDRAALIGMGKNLEVAKAVLEETQSRSWQLIWLNEVQSRLTSASKTEEKQPFQPIAEKEPEKPEIQPEPISEDAENGKEPTPTAKVTKASKFHGLERAEEVAAIYTNQQGRAYIGKLVSGRGGKEIWALILSAIDQGFLVRNSCNFPNPSLRVLFPLASAPYCRQFDLALPRDRAKIRDSVLPAAIANRGAVLANPDDLENIINAHQQRLAAAEQEAKKQRRIADALAAMPPNEREIIIFGERVWPNTDPSAYDYDQVRAAVWYFRDLNGWLEQSPIAKSPQSRAIYIRNSMSWFLQYIGRSDPAHSPHKIKRVFHLVHRFAGLLETSPDAECVLPPSPHIEGEW